MIENRAIAGLLMQVVSGPILFNYSRTDLHAAKVYEMLKMTHTIQEAVDEADRLYHVQSMPYDPNPDPSESVIFMDIHGDPKSTICGVYDGQNTPEEQTK